MFDWIKKSKFVLIIMTIFLFNDQILQMSVTIKKLFLRPSLNVCRVKIKAVTIILISPIFKKGVHLLVDHFETF
jgi:hypothetical protein